MPSGSQKQILGIDRSLAPPDGFGARSVSSPRIRDEACRIPWRRILAPRARPDQPDLPRGSRTGNPVHSTPRRMRDRRDRRLERSDCRGCPIPAPAWSDRQCPKRTHSRCCSHSWPRASSPSATSSRRMALRFVDSQTAVLWQIGVSVAIYWLAAPFYMEAWHWDGIGPAPARRARMLPPAAVGQSRNGGDEDPRTDSQRDPLGDVPRCSASPSGCCCWRKPCPGRDRDRHRRDRRPAWS